MKSLTELAMNIIATLIAALMCFGQTTACTTGHIGEPPNPKVTFELPQRWVNLSETEYHYRSDWSAYLMPPPDAEGKYGVSISAFSLTELKGKDDDTDPGATPKEKAEKYYERTLHECRPELYNCTVEPIREVEYAGIKAYSITDNNDGWMDSGYWGTHFFFEKNGQQFGMNVRNKFDEEPTQKIYKKIFETIKVEY